VGAHQGRSPGPIIFSVWACWLWEGYGRRQCGIVAGLFGPSHSLQRTSSRGSSIVTRLGLSRPKDPGGRTLSIDHHHEGVWSLSVARIATSTAPLDLRSREAVLEKIRAKSDLVSASRRCRGSEARSLSLFEEVSNLAARSRRHRRPTAGSRKEPRERFASLILVSSASRLASSTNWRVVIPLALEESDQIEVGAGFLKRVGSDHRSRRCSRYIKKAFRQPVTDKLGRFVRGSSFRRPPSAGGGARVALGVSRILRELLRPVRDGGDPPNLCRRC